MISIKPNLIRVRVRVSGDHYDSFTHIDNSEDFTGWSDSDIVDFINSKLSHVDISEDDL